MTLGEAYRVGSEAVQVGSRGHTTGSVINARHARDCRIRDLWTQGVTATAIAAELDMSEDQVWHARDRLHLPRRRGSGHYGPLKAPRKPHSNISRVDSAVRAYHEPVTVDEGAGGGLIVYIGDVPGRECEGIVAALRSAVAARG
jgi:hypothetical protein